MTDGGIETTLIFRERLDLPCFAAFHLLQTEEGTQALASYFRGYAKLAQKYKAGLVLESPTWRANLDWGAKLGYSPEQLEVINKKAMILLADIRQEFQTPQIKIVLSGCLGPRDDGYNPSKLMTVQEAEKYHAFQVHIFQNTQADFVTAMTMTYPEEATGIALAARTSGIPVALSFTVETDGRLPTGQTLEEAILKVDKLTDSFPVYYMINCAHPSHFSEVLKKGAAWTRRIKGVRANASRQSHAELNEATVLDDGNPKEFGEEHRTLRKIFPDLNIMGGCCGTDERHVEALCKIANGKS